MSTVPGKLLALDVGLARIGVAVCDPLRLAARPFSVLRRRSRNQDFAILADWLRSEQAVAVICGLPLNMDGTESNQSTTTRKWALRLAQALRVLLGHPMPVIFWDERLSTFAAQQLLAGSDGIAEDAAAAAVILQSYLDAQRRGDAPEYGRIELAGRGQDADDGSN